MSSSSTRRFLFETSFDDPFDPVEALDAAPEPEPLPEPEPEPPEAEPPAAEPSFSQAELLQAHEDRYADGLAAGRAAAEAEATGQFAAVMAAVERHLDALLQDAEAGTRRRREEALGIGLAVARKLLPAFVERHGLAEVEATIGRCIAELIDEPRLVIRVGETWLEAVSEKLDALATQRGFAGKLILLGEPALGSGDCRIEWAEGGMEKDAAKIWRDVDRIAERYVAAAPAAQDETPSAPDADGDH